MTARYRVWIFVCVALLVGGSAAGQATSPDLAGSLVVESNPAGATVYLDGRLAGETPLMVATVSAGAHRVRLVRLGYIENSRLVTVKVGTRAAIRAQLTASAPPLKIVVVEGEGAVNIIQQKTAVAPVIEVRDRNDQPVAGAVVRFAIQKGKASFNDARTLTATTDALGRVTATGLTPIGNGPLQIGASAAFQGQTATITIAQTNVLTAAQASSAAAGGGGTAGGGGGLSHLAIAGIVSGGAAGIGAAVIAGKASRDSGSANNTNTNTNTNSSILWDVIFSPSLDVTACGPGTGGGFGSQVLSVDSSGTFRQTWGNALGTSAAVSVLEANGTMTATGLSGTLRCFAAPATGTISATPSGPDYLGSATLSGVTVTIRVNKRSQ